MDLVDVHCHLDFDRYKEDLYEVIKRASDNGVKFIISSGINPRTNRRVLEIQDKYPKQVLVSFGIYPIDAIAEKIKDFGGEEMLRDVEKFDVDLELEWIEENKDKCVAIGEVGLDYKVVQGYEDEQKGVFKKIIDLAKRIDKPLIIHSRNAEKDAVDLLEEMDCKKVLMHCFSGKKSLIKRCVDLGWYFSVPAVITRLEHFKMLAEVVPLEQILTETDGPFLSPVAGERSEPKDVLSTIKEIAKIKNLSEEEVASKIFNNFNELFNLN